MTTAAAAARTCRNGNVATTETTPFNADAFLDSLKDDDDDAVMEELNDIEYKINKLSEGPLDLCEVSDHAVWSLSTCKMGFGVEQLLDQRSETYWQSDGPQPHLINAQFQRRTAVCRVSLLVDYAQDESYTPSKISVRVGTTFHDLREVQLVELEEPTGWVQIDILEEDGSPTKMNLVQIAIMTNHQNGRDSHLRGIRIAGPRLPVIPHMPRFASVTYNQYACVR